MKPQKFNRSHQAIDTSAINAALKALKPRKQAATDMIFAEVYPGIREALDRKVPKKALISALKEHGLSLSPAKFNALLDAEAVHRGEVGSSDAAPLTEPAPAVTAVTLS